MKPDWDKLSDVYADSKSVLIADVDCTSDEGKPVCEAHEVQGFPTLKYWVKGVQHDYEGGRAFEQLKKFVDDNLAAACSIDDLEESCTEKEQKYFNKMMGKGLEEVKKQHVRLDKMKTKKMTATLTNWLHARLDILTQIIEADEGDNAAEVEGVTEKEEL